MRLVYLFIFLIIAFGAKAQSHFCGDEAYKTQLLKSYPAYIQAEEKGNQLIYDYLTQSRDASANTERTTLSIPVVYHILHQNGPENVPDSVIIHSLNNMNLRFQNAAPFNNIAGGVANIEFCLASVDPWGNPTTGITRDTTIFSYFSNPPTQIEDFNLKNVNRWCPATYLNIWILNYSGGIAYATYANSPQEMDGIVAPYLSLPSYVMSHEAGHYLNLAHTFTYLFDCTNFNCLIDGDKVCDTPPDYTSDFISCEENSCSTELADTSGFNPFTSDQPDSPNYMDYTVCPLLFTPGQTERMEATLTLLRPTLLQSNGCGANPGGAIPVASFTVDSSFCLGTGTLAFHSTSTNSLYTAWDFNNDGRTDGVGDSIEHTFTEPGTYAVRMTVTGFGGSDSMVQIINVYVNPTSTFPLLASSSGTSTDPILGAKVACAGTTITLFGEPGMSSYLWSNGATTPNITFTIDTTLNVYLTVTDNSGRQITNCEPLTILVNQPPTLTITAGADTIDCQDLMTIRMMPQPYWNPTTNNWYQNGNWLSINQHVLASFGYPPGSHSIWVTDHVDPIGCVTNSDTLTFFVNDAPPVFLTLQGNELYLPFRCLFTTWFKDGNPLNVNDSVLTITENGCYFASCASCGYYESDTICITTVGFADALASDGISIYPNPFTSETTIAFTQEQFNTNLVMMDALGKIVHQEQFSGKHFTLRRDEISAGVYFLRIENKFNRTVHRKIIVQ